MLTKCVNLFEVHEEAVANPVHFLHRISNRVAVLTKKRKQ